jgi:hypothetical protein
MPEDFTRYVVLREVADAVAAESQPYQPGVEPR